MRPRAVCGTNGGYYAHRRRGEHACLPCCDAQNDHTRYHNIRSGRQRTVHVPIGLLAQIVAAVPDAVREEIAVALGWRTVEAIAAFGEVLEPIPGGEAA